MPVSVRLLYDYTSWADAKMLEAAAMRGPGQWLALKAERT